ncbi:MAG: glutamine synthetase family protein [Candidatus Asgardarchaeia archaeon]
MAGLEMIDYAKKKGVKYVFLQFTDILGRLRTITITIERLQSYIEEGTAVDGSSIEGFAKIEDSDLVLKPIPRSFIQLPWNEKVARIICEVRQPDGSPFEGDPRYILEQYLLRVERNMGLKYYVGPELEFFLLREDKPADNAFYYATAPLDKSTGYRIEMADYIEYFGLLPEYLHHEVAPGQQEINFRFSDALTIADGVQVYKLVATHLAEKYGLVATFMPKPFFGMNGSGMHVHQSVFFADSNENAFAGEKEGTLSELAFNFIAGLLKYAPAITAITSPTVNSYKRLVPGYEAPVYITWGYGNRSALIRVPKYALKSKSRIRIEYRSPDPSSNPYLAFAVMLAAGIQGIKEELEPPEPLPRNLYKLTEEERKKLGIKTLPGSLDVALEEMKKAPFIKEVLGEHIYTKFIELKTKEWKEYTSEVKEPYTQEVTEWERKKYLYW